MSFKHVQYNIHRQIKRLNLANNTTVAQVDTFIIRVVVQLPAVNIRGEYKQINDYNVSPFLFYVDDQYNLLDQLDI